MNFQPPEDDDFVEIYEHHMSTIEDDLIAAIKSYITLDDNRANILQRGNDLAGKYYDLMIDIGVEHGIVEYSRVPNRSA